MSKTDENFCGPLLKLGMGLSIRLMMVKPAVAIEWLKKNHPLNRKLRSRLSTNYATDMASGNWSVNDQPISFDEEDFLVNGNNRLTACVASGSPFLTLVLYGLPKTSMPVLDGASKRSTDENIKIAGLDFPKGCGGTVRRIKLGFATFGANMTDREVIDFMEQHGDSVTFAHHALNAGKACTASVRATVARAHIAGHNPERLKEFAEVVKSGLMVPGDEAAVLLRNELISGVKASHGSARPVQYALAQEALKLFLESKRIRTLGRATKENFPIPGEEGYKPQPKE